MVYAEQHFWPGACAGRPGRFETEARGGPATERIKDKGCGMSRSQNLNNREYYHANQMAALAGADLPALARTVGLSADAEGRVALKFLGRDFLATNSGVEAADGRASMDHQSVIAHYLTSGGSGELTGEYVPIGRLTGMVNTGSTPSGNLTRPLTDKFGDKYEAFAEAARRIGGCHEGRSPSGGEAWLFRPLPNLPIQIVFFEADDEFPAEVKVMFDSSATKFVSYECLEVMEIALTAELLGAAGLLGCGSHGEGDHCGCGCDHHK